jgi:hypothetical protein
MSTNEATLENLPSEMANHVCTFLSKNDLLSLRLVSRQIAAHTVTALAEDLQHVLYWTNVLVTKAGLQVLLGLTQIPEFLLKIRKIKFVGCVQEMLSHASLRFGEQIPCQITLRHALMSEQKSFEESGELVELLSQCFRNLKDSKVLHRINLGGRIDGEEPEWTCGFRALKRKLNWRGTTLHHLNNNMSFSRPLYTLDAALVLLRVMRDTGMESKLGHKVAHLHIRLTPNISNNWLRSDDSCWATLSDLRKLRIAGHDDVPDEQDLDWVEKCFHHASNIESLTVEGCELLTECPSCPSWYQNHSKNYNVQYPRCFSVGNGCNGCRALHQGLSKSSFEHLHNLWLSELGLDEGTILRLLRSSQSTLGMINIQNIDIILGSWQKMFSYMMDQCSKLCKMVCGYLYQHVKSATSAIKGRGSWEIRASGKEDVARSLKQVVDSFTVHIVYEKRATVVVQFPDDGASIIRSFNPVYPALHYFSDDDSEEYVDEEWEDFLETELEGGRSEEDDEQNEKDDLFEEGDENSWRDYGE